MKQLTCKMCGGTDLVKEDGVFVCENCGMKYSVEDAKKMMMEDTVDVQSPAEADNSAYSQPQVEKNIPDTVTDNSAYSQPQVEKNIPDTVTDNSKSTISIILGGIGIVMAWLFAIVGWILGGTALGFAISAQKKSEGKAKIALIISIIAIACSFISSAIGVAMMP